MNPETTNNPSQINPTPNQVAGSSKKCKHMPIIIILAILTVAGIGFGGFELWQNMQKDSKIADLEAQIGEVERVIGDENISNDENPFSEGVLASIKQSGMEYNFKSTKGYGDEFVYAKIDSNANLLFGYLDNFQNIASDVIYADFLFEGQAGESLYFVKSDGSAGVVKNVTDKNYKTEKPLAEEISTDSKVVSVKNITTPAGYKVVLVDADGSFINL